MGGCMLEAKATRRTTQEQGTPWPLFHSPKVNKTKAKGGRGSRCQKGKRKDVNYI